MAAMTYEEKLEKTRQWRKRQARETRISICRICGETLRRLTDDGLCGFCRQGIPPDETSPNWRSAA
jgi:rubrerythrin